MIVSDAQTVGERPQPKPRLSLLVNPQEIIENPFYENLHSLRNDLLDYSHQSNSSNSQYQSCVIAKPKPRRRSFLDLPLNELSIFKDDDLVESKLSYNIHQSSEIIYNCVPQKKCLNNNKDALLISVRVNLDDNLNNDTSEQKNNCDIKINSHNVHAEHLVNCKDKQPNQFGTSENINKSCIASRNSVYNVKSENIQDNQFRSGNFDTCDSFHPIRCMPYNSPQLTKGPRGPGSLQTGTRRDVKTTTISKSVTKASVTKMSASNNKVDNIRSSVKSVKDKSSNNAIPARSERGAVSTLQQLRRPSFKKLEEASRESDSSDCSSGVSSGSVSSILSNRRRAESLNARTTEFRRSAAVPPQTVATLTNKFNAIISQNQHISKNSVVNNKAIKVIESNSSFAKSCPSSPLRSNIKPSSLNQSKKDFKSISTKPSKHFVRGSVLHSSFPERGKDGETRRNITQLIDFHTSDSDSSSVSTSSSNGAKSFVKRTVLNYEVNISSATSSPELERRSSFTRRTSDSSGSCSSPLLSKRRLHAATSSQVLTNSISNDKETSPISSHLSTSKAIENEEISTKTDEICKEDKLSKCHSRNDTISKKIFQSKMDVENKQTSTNSHMSMNTSKTTTRILNIRRNIQPNSVVISNLSEDVILTQENDLGKNNASNISFKENKLSKTEQSVSSLSFKDDINLGKNNDGKSISNISDNSQKTSDNLTELSPICKARMILERRNKTSTEKIKCTADPSEVKRNIPPPLPATGPRVISTHKDKNENSVPKKVIDKSCFYLHPKMEEKNNSNKSEHKDKEDTEPEDKNKKLIQNKLPQSELSQSKVNAELTLKNVQLEEKGLKTTALIPKEENEKSQDVSLKSSFLHSFHVDKQEKISKIWHAKTFTSDVKDNKEELIVKKLEIGKSNYVPNTSFLWREGKFQKNNLELNIIPPPPTTAPPPIPSQKESDDVLSFHQEQESNIYDDVISPISEDNYDEPLYSEAIIPKDNESNSSEDSSAQVTYLEMTQHLNLNNKDESKQMTDNNSHNDSDEGWEDVDVSDAEQEIGIYKHSSLPLQTKARSHVRKSSSKQIFRRSWSQTLRELVSSNEDLLNSTENEQNSLKFLHEGSFDSDDSGSTDPSHHYEALYEVVSQSKFHNDKSEFPERNNSCGQNQRNEILETDCILEESPDAIEDQDYIIENFQKKTTVDLGKPKQLKRNWSLTKSDIRLELTSRLNRIRIKKTSTSASDVHIESTDGQVNDHKKKSWSLKTKFSRKKSVVSLPSPNSLSPKKESALFYVENYVNKTENVNDKNNEITSKDNQTNVAESKQISTESKTSNPAIVGQNSANSRKTHRVSSQKKVTRPKTAPPAPPAHPSRVKETVNLEDSTSNVSISPALKAKNSQNELKKTCKDDKNLENCCDQDESKETKSSLDGESLNSVQNADQFSIVSVSRSNSVASSESEFYQIVRITHKRSSLTSTTSTSSSDTYIQMGELETAKLMSAIASEAVEYRSSKTSLLESMPSESVDFSSQEKTKIYDSAMLASFEDEPLYQIYLKDAQKRATQSNLCDNCDEYDEYENYEIIGESSFKSDQIDTKSSDLNMPVAKQAMDLVGSSGSGQRTLWGELPEVINSGLLEKISPQMRKLQEAMFEVITSEASYLKSLNVLTNHFMQCKEFIDEYSPNCVLNKRERHVLFSDILAVKTVSEKLLADLEKRWQEDIMISEICDILHEHAKANFSVYITYCSNQVHQDEMLKELKEKNPQFIEVLRRLESNPICQNLTMHSFLMLPMQRITRLPLLVDSIFQRLEENTSQYERCQIALNTLNKIVYDCNEGACKMARYKEMLQIIRTLDFRDKKGIPLISASRNVWLVKKGDLNRIVFCESTSRLSFRRCYKQMVSLFLFTDLVIITKKKGEESYQVIDYCPRNMVQAKIINTDSLPMRPPDGCKNLFQLTLLQNHERRTIDIILSCNLESDRDRWIDAVTPPISENPDEKIYEQWDCPQVQVIHEYKAKQPDELNLEESDVINIFKKVSDGWYHGERLRDGIQGWFPANYTVEIISEHIRARNLRQRYRLLQCLEEQRRGST